MKERRWYHVFDGSDEASPPAMDKALTKKQRQTILERDGFEPQDLKYSEELGFYRQLCETCKHKGKDGRGHPQVNHIHPRGWQDETGNFGRSTLTNGEVDGCNLLTICRGTHVGTRCDGTEEEGFVVHSDTQEANKKYRNGNKRAYEEMTEQRNAKKKSGMIYWNTAHDQEFLDRAEELEHKPKKGLLGIFKKR